MTRKHFRELAQVLRINGRGLSTDAERILWREIRDDIAALCSHHNGNFDRGRFIAACEPDGE